MPRHEDGLVLDGLRGPRDAPLVSDDADGCSCAAARWPSRSCACSFPCHVDWGCAGAGRARNALDHRDHAEVDSAPRAGICPEHRDELSCYGDRNGIRPRARARSDFAPCAYTRQRAPDHAILSQLSVASALVLLHAFAALRGSHRQQHCCAARLGQINLRVGPSRHGECVRLVRGAVQSIPAGQWEAAEALAFTRLQTLRMIILPQCIKRMTPPWMNLYAILTVATPLTSVVGVSEAMTLTGDILSSEGRTELLVPMYLYLLMWFFVYCYPIARATVALERRFAVR